MAGVDLQTRKKDQTMDAEKPVFLLSIRGTLAPKTLESAREVHNRTAGAPQNVAAARSLSDLSHMVYVPITQNGGPAGEFLILDLWNNIEGLNQFFSNHQVQEQAGEIFSQRDPVVWKPAEGFFSYHFPAPYGRNERIVATVRGTVRSVEEARQVHNELVGSMVNTVRAAGDMTHDAYLRLSAPGDPQALEFFAVDTWYDAEGMNKIYNDPAFMAGFSRLFAAPPTTGVWVHPAGNWVEW